LRREVGKLGFSYESEVLTWTNIDFTFSYAVRLTLLSHVIHALLVYISVYQRRKVHFLEYKMPTFLGYVILVFKCLAGLF
jgi:hypothetical protein